jgi:alkylation response protein AidB-like acyl-CoA dehydrogenase
MIDFSVALDSGLARFRSRPGMTMDKIVRMSLGLSASELALKTRAQEFADRVARPRAAAIDRDEQYPWDIVEALRDAGFLGMTIPKSLGGQDRSFLDAVLVTEEMSKACTVTGRIVVETNMGALSTVMAYGTDEQKQLAAKLVLGGDKPAICITEPEAGSDAMAMTTRADKRGDVYVINGKKHWITGGGISKLHLIFARVFDERGDDLGIGGFLAVRDDAKGSNKGLKVTRREKTMGLRGMPEGEIVFENLEVPAAMMITPPSGIRRGFADLMNAYNSQRVGAGTVAMGVAAGALDHALAFVKEREQFGRPIGEFQGLQWMLADMQTQLNAARLMLYAAARSRGPNGSVFPDPMLAAQAKLFASESAIRIVNDALQMFGARGYSRDLPLERMARDVRMFTIGGGTAQVLRTLIASKMLGWKLPQTRDGYAPPSIRDAAE